MHHQATSFLAALATGLALFVAMPAQAGKGELIDIAWAADGGFGRDVRVAPSQFVEVCGRLPAGTVVDWRFESGAPMSYNIHFHEGKAVRYAARGEGATRSQSTLEARTEEDYCWMWTNATPEPATLTFMLTKRDR